MPCTIQVYLTLRFVRNVWLLPAPAGSRVLVTVQMIGQRQQSRAISSSNGPLTWDEQFIFEARFQDGCQSDDVVVFLQGEKVAVELVQLLPEGESMEEVPHVLGSWTTTVWQLIHEATGAGEESSVEREITRTVLLSSSNPRQLPLEPPSLTFLLSAVVLDSPLSRPPGAAKPARGVAELLQGGGPRAAHPEDLRLHHHGRGDTSTSTPGGEAGEAWGRGGPVQQQQGGRAWKARKRRGRAGDTAGRVAVLEEEVHRLTSLVGSLSSEVRHQPSRRTTSKPRRNPPAVSDRLEELARPQRRFIMKNDRVVPVPEVTTKTRKRKKTSGTAASKKKNNNNTAIGDHPPQDKRCKKKSGFASSSLMTVDGRPEKTNMQTKADRVQAKQARLLDLRIEAVLEGGDKKGSIDVKREEHPAKEAHVVEMTSSPVPGPSTAPSVDGTGVIPRSNQLLHTGTALLAPGGDASVPPCPVHAPHAYNVELRHNLAGGKTFGGPRDCAPLPLNGHQFTSDRIVHSFQDHRSSIKEQGKSRAVSRDDVSPLVGTSNYSQMTSREIFESMLARPSATAAGAGSLPVDYPPVHSSNNNLVLDARPFSSYTNYLRRIRG